MDQEQVVTKHHALLIGINFYPERPLQGCVRDVEMIKKYLYSKRIPVQVAMFTATAPSDPALLGPIEDPEVWPTYENVTASLEKITSNANPGDFFYLHYSGHGTRIEASSIYSNKTTGDLALDLLEEGNGNKIRYLRGLELAFFIKNMVTKGLVVTLILDCCFSGSVLRHDDLSGARYLDYDPETDMAHPPNPRKCLSCDSFDVAYRDGSMLPNWLIHPAGYTILTACGPLEIARELKFEDGQRRGALSYFLHRTLSKLGSNESKQRHIYHHLCSKFHESWPRQNPMCYGNMNLSFFGGLKSEPNSSLIPVFRTGTGSLYLRAGLAHGVCDGDKFALYPFFPNKEASINTTQDPVMVQSMKSEPLTSILEGVDGAPIPSYVQTGWNAKAINQFSLQKVPILLTPSLPNRDRWLAAARERFSLDLHTVDVDGHPFLFHVAMNGLGEYEIQNAAHKRIFGFSNGPHDQEEGLLARVFDALEHLTRFKQIEAIDNPMPTSSFETTFSIRLSSSLGEACHSTYVVEARHNDKLSLVIQNRGNEDLYLHIYDMGPLWQVKNLLDGDYMVVPKANIQEGTGGILNLELLMTIPDFLVKKGHHQCEDIIKVFITEHQTSFLALEMGKLAELSNSESTRGDILKVNTFLSDMVNTSFRGGFANGVAANWASQNFQICTIMKDMY
jgi:hypothetical protein